jgi:hypothetical protein
MFLCCWFIVPRNPQVYVFLRGKMQCALSGACKAWQPKHTSLSLRSASWTLSVAANAHLKHGSQSSPELVTDVRCFNILVIFVGAAHLIPSHSHVTHKHTHNGSFLQVNAFRTPHARTHARTHALVSARAHTHTHTHTSRTRYFCFGAISILAIEVTSSLIFIGRRSASFFFVVMKALCPHKDTDAPSRNDTDALTNPQMNVRGFQAAFKHTTRTRLRI